MTSNRKIFFYVLFPAILLFSCFSQVRATYLAEMPSLKELGSQDWVSKKIEKYPELQWLLAADVQQTQEGKSESFDHSWSQKLTGQHHPEFERTILSMVCLYLIADGSEEAYKRFTMLQPPEDKLSHASFKRLHDFADNVLSKDPQLLQAIEANLLLGDLGETQVARQIAEPYTISEPDHDRFLAACLKECPHIFPTFQSLTPKIQSKIKNMTGLVHFGHVTHVEGGPSMLTELKTSGVLQNDPSDFDFEVLTHLCDVSAARGHEDNRGSKVLTENTFSALENVKNALHYLADHNEEEALKYYLLARAEGLGLDNKDQAQQFVLARLGAMMRLFSKEEGAALQEGYQALSQEQRDLLNNELNPLIVRHEMTPTYVPATLVNLLSTYSKQGLSKDEAIKKCLQEGVPFVAHILHQYRSGKAEQPYTPTLTLNFNKVAGQLRDQPDLLRNATFSIGEDGHVEIKELVE